MDLFLIAFGANSIFAIATLSRTEYNASGLLDVKTTARNTVTFFTANLVIFQSLLTRFFLPPKSEPSLVILQKMHAHYSEYSYENATPSSVTAP